MYMYILTYSNTHNKHLQQMHKQVKTPVYVCTCILKLTVTVLMKLGYLQVPDCCPIEIVQEIWPTIMDFDWPNTEIGYKIVNGWLFLALQ